MSRIENLYNKLNNATCPKKIDSLIYEIKTENSNWKDRSIEEQRVKMIELQKKKEKTLFYKIKKFLK